MIDSRATVDLHPVRAERGILWAALLASVETRAVLRRAMPAPLYPPIEEDEI